MKDFVQFLREKYEIILFDTPPCIVITDSVVLSRFTDGVVLVASTNLTRIAALERAKEVLEQAGANLLGIVCNRFNFAKAYGSYYHYYHYYYNYYTANGEKKKKVKRRSRSA
jgi:Mrp family chromosome partitioning ATPase